MPDTRRIQYSEPKRSRRKTILLITLILLSAAVLTACIPGDGRATPSKPAGFFWGVWHGWVAPISLVIGIFNNNIRIYEANNTGWWYDLGFYMAIISGFGGLSLVRRARKR
jgi:hypothetical protein